MTPLESSRPDRLHFDYTHVWLLKEISGTIDSEVVRVPNCQERDLGSNPYQGINWVYRAISGTIKRRGKELATRPLMPRLIR